MTHEFDFKKKFSNDLKADIIERRKNKLITKGYTEKQALKRAKEEMMPTRKYGMYAFVMQTICDYYDVPTNTDYVDISTNRHGEHSWYLKLSENKVIRVSDHLSYDRYVNILITTKCIIIINSPYDQDGVCEDEYNNDIVCIKDDFVFKFHKHVLSFEKENAEKYKKRLQYSFDEDFSQFVYEAIDQLNLSMQEGKLESIRSFLQDAESNLIGSVIADANILSENTETSEYDIALMYEKLKDLSLFNNRYNYALSLAIRTIKQKYDSIDWVAYVDKK